VRLFKFKSAATPAKPKTPGINPRKSILAPPNTPNLDTHRFYLPKQTDKLKLLGSPTKIWRFYPHVISAKINQKGQNY